MNDLHRGAWTWDRVWIGCGASACAVRCAAGEMYTGPAFESHRAIVEHLGLAEPEILSAKHGLITWVTEIDPCDTKPEHAGDWRRFSAEVLREVQTELADVLRHRHRVRVSPTPTIDGCQMPPRKCREHGLTGWRLWCGCTCPCREGHGDAFGPVQQPSILVLAEAPYLDGWIEQARAMGVRVDDPLRGYSLDDRRMIARRFCAETPRWTGEGCPAWSHSGEHVDHAHAWGTAPEQLLNWLDAFDLERSIDLDDLPQEHVAAEQMSLWGEQGAAHA